MHHLERLQDLERNLSLRPSNGATRLLIVILILLIGSVLCGLATELWAIIISDNTS